MKLLCWFNQHPLPKVASTLLAKEQLLIWRKILTAVTASKKDSEKTSSRTEKEASTDKLTNLKRCNLVLLWDNLCLANNLS